MVRERLSLTRSVNELMRSELKSSPEYQDDTAAPTPAAASTPVKRLAQLFSTLSAMA